MQPSRRVFVQQLTTGAVGLSGMAALAPGLPAEFAPAPVQGTWDLTWVRKLTGKHKACFDCAEVESGYGVWRASAWAGQYADVMRVAAADLSPLVILRHNAIVLAMQQSFWDKYGIGKAKGVTHPLTGEPTDRNPALLDEGDGVPAPFNQAALHKQIARGVVALACNLALQDCVELVKRTDGVGDDEARRRAVSALVPGVILQPSGVFAAVRAQEAGCSYVKSS